MLTLKQLQIMAPRLNMSALSRELGYRSNYLWQIIRGRIVFSPEKASEIENLLKKYEILSK